jgi:hypothetical protein
MLSMTPNEPPILTGRHVAAPAVNCPQPTLGDRTSLEVCEACVHKKEIFLHFVDCNYTQSQQDKDEIERKRKGVGITKPQSSYLTKDPGQPKNVFIKK